MKFLRSKRPNSIELPKRIPTTMEPNPGVTNITPLSKTLEIYDWEKEVPSLKDNDTSPNLTSTAESRLAPIVGQIGISGAQTNEPTPAKQPITEILDQRISYKRGGFIIDLQEWNNS